MAESTYLRVRGEWVKRLSSFHMSQLSVSQPEGKNNKEGSKSA